jgi:predicted nucleic acid-binding Zn ribbon protein
MGELSMGDAIREFLSRSRLKGGIQARQIGEVWEQVMGKTIAKYTDSISVVNGTLFVSTHVAPLKQELLYQKEIIVARVNEAMGETVIKDVVIR